MILIVGAGFLGSYLLKHIKETTDERVMATTKSKNRIEYLHGAEVMECDLRQLSDIKRLAHACCGEKLDVFYFAACHHIDFIYENEKEAYDINVTSLQNFLDEMPDIRRFIFASTDCVYGEDNGRKLKEGDALNPVNIYGRQKILAEKAVLNKGFTALRLPFMLGKSLIEKNHFYDNIYEKLQNKTEVEMIDGMWRNVLSYRDVAEILLKLMKKEEPLPQVINIGGDKLYTKYDVGCVLAKRRGYDISFIKKISEKEGEKFFKDKRTSSADMDNTLLKSLLGVEQIRWEEDIC